MYITFKVGLILSFLIKLDKIRNKSSPRNYCHLMKKRKEKKRKEKRRKKKEKVKRRSQIRICKRIVSIVGWRLRFSVQVFSRVSFFLSFFFSTQLQSAREHSMNCETGTGKKGILTREGILRATEDGVLIKLEISFALFLRLAAFLGSYYRVRC